MRRGVMLVELLVVLAVLAAFSLGAGVVFRTALTDVPRALRLVDVNGSVADMLRRLGQDVDAATSLPAAVGKTVADDRRLLVELPDGVVCYELAAGKVVRHRLGPEGRPGGASQVAWLVPDAQIAWRLWHKDGQAYAVELTTSIRYVQRGRPLSKLSNSRLYFLGSIPAAGRKT